jgi:hypothetical protein
LENATALGKLARIREKTGDQAGADTSPERPPTATPPR